MAVLTRLPVSSSIRRAFNKPACDSLQFLVSVKIDEQTVINRTRTTSEVEREVYEYA